MKEITSGDWQTSLAQRLANQPPFSSLDSSDLTSWLQSGEQLQYSPGDRLIRPDEVNSGVLLVIKGTVRLISYGDERERIYPRQTRPGQLIGWTSLLRGRQLSLFKRVPKSWQCRCRNIFCELRKRDTRIRRVFQQIK